MGNHMPTQEMSTSNDKAAAEAARGHFYISLG